MIRHVSVVAMVAALCLPLAGCVTDKGRPDVSVQLPRSPTYYRQCFAKLTNIPEEDLDRERVIKLVAELRQSELRKSRCGKDLLDWYDRVVAAYAKK